MEFMPHIYKRINASLRSLAVNREQCSRDGQIQRLCLGGANNGELLSYPFPSPSLPPPPPPPPPHPPPPTTPPTTPPSHHPPIPLLRGFLFVRFHSRTELSR